MNTLRLYFLSAFFALGAVWPLLGLAFAARGLSPSEYAWLMALWPLSRLLASPLWGALADRRLGATRLLQINGWASALSMLALAIFETPAATAVSFVLWAFFSSSLAPLAEAGTYDLLRERAASFGYVRVFGSIGFATSALGVSFLALGADSAGPFALAALGYFAAVLVSHRLGASSPGARSKQQPAKLTLRLDLVLLWLSSTLYSAAHGFFDVYFGPYVRSLPGISTEIVGRAWGIGVLFEIACLWFMPRVLSGRVTSWVLPGSALIAALRWWLLAHVTSAAEVLWLSPLHAITFGAWYMSYVHESQAVAEPHQRATVQGIAAACTGLGVIGASVVGGYALEHWGGRRLYELAALAAFASFLLYLLRLALRNSVELSPRALSGQD